ncbi:hypothetical protein TVAG_242650 [Trichomonas vaginalis G3]|uniref:Uncharacterized protein n=1 Tax=Trichomonas vaginalis (strain ATCC PRA-98 / G3) TaxID=412133 RepID=A2G5V5_TRIV3|nr:hypothetical protein TVAG_242650 [Trichomonas vaginalis G3]|eukprot:XP_001300389.1 hypothetical protein [Trichomonas vaginalis G3]
MSTITYVCNLGPDIYSASNNFTPEFLSIEQFEIETYSSYKTDSESDSYQEEKDYGEEPLNENIIEPHTIEFDQDQILAVNIFNYAAQIAALGNPVTEEHIQKANVMLFNGRVKGWRPKAS